MRAVVVALGDLGRSARMLYHAQALAANGLDVDLVGFEGTPLPKAVADDLRIKVRRLNPATLRLRRGVSGSTYAVAGLVDAARLSLRLWRTLRTLRRPDLVLIQNPPAFPTLAVAWFSLRRRGVRFVIDWHNLGYTLLSLRLGQWHPAVRLARWLARRDARRVAANRCGVRAPVCRAARTPCPLARALARAGGLSARRGQRRPWALPAPILIRARHSDEGGGFVRCRGAGVRARLRCLSGGARPPRRQRPAVFDRAPALGRPVRSVRDVPARSAAARPVARRRPQIRPPDVGAGLGARGEAGPVAQPLVSRNSDSSHNSRAGHPGLLRCSSPTYSRYARSSRLSIRAPRSGTYATNHCYGTLDDGNVQKCWGNPGLVHDGGMLSTIRSSFLNS